ncbi:MAG TPA: hypothetical protein VJH22_00720, partial [Candidatus Nanoarchaeia archaeon]|nr:hypothetical protein [Candidatus Nanoarchaeia archaeon]
AFQHGWRWLFVYGLLCGTGLLTMIIFGVLVALGIPGMAAGLLFGLIALAWWRMISWEILSGNVKKIP